ncbi:MAG: sialidase family protein [Candidatus Thorarchaeota archaeon]
MGHDIVKVVGVPLISEMNVIWETDTNPEPFSGHTGCEVLYAFDKYWLYYDWVPEDGGSSNPNVYMRYSPDAKTWSNAIPLADELVPEHTVKAVYCEDTIYVIYIRGQALYYQSSIDGLNYDTPKMMFELPGAGAYSGDVEIVYGDGVFYVASMFNSPDLWVMKSTDLETWSEPYLAAGDPEAVDFICDLCWADGKLWLFWDKSVSGNPAYLFAAYSSDGIEWSPPIPIPPFRSSYEHWGASVIWDNGQFILVARIAEPISHGSWPPFVSYRWRLYLTTSEDGINWTPFREVTEFSLDGDYGEKAPGVFPIYKGDRSFSYSIIYKKYWFDGPYQICQSFLDRWKD